MSIKVFTVFLYYFFSIHEISSNGPSFISDMSNFCLFYFFVSLANSLSIILTSSNNVFDFFNFLSLSHFLFIFFLFLLALYLYFFYFFRLLNWKLRLLILYLSFLIHLLSIIIFPPSNAFAVFQIC